MARKIILWMLYLVFAGLLILGAIYRTNVKARNEPLGPHRPAVLEGEEQISLEERLPTEVLPRAPELQFLASSNLMLDYRFWDLTNSSETQERLILDNLKEQV